MLLMSTMRGLNLGDFSSVEGFVHISRHLPVISELPHLQGAPWVLDSRSTQKRAIQGLHILLTEPAFFVCRSGKK